MRAGRLGRRPRGAGRFCPNGHGWRVARAGTAGSSGSAARRRPPAAGRGALAAARPRARAHRGRPGPATPGGTRVTVDGGVGSQAIRGRRHHAAGAPSTRAGPGAAGAPVARAGSGPEPATGAAVPSAGGRARPGSTGCSGRVGGRRAGVRTAQRRHARPGCRRAGRRPDDGPAQQRRPDDVRPGRLRSVGPRVGREVPPHRANEPGRRARQVPGEVRPALPHPGERWAATVVRQRGRWAPAARHGAAAARVRRGRGGWPVIRPAARWRRLPRPGTVDRSTGGGARFTLARGRWRRGLRRTAARTGAALPAYAG